MTEVPVKSEIEADQLYNHSRFHKWLETYIQFAALWDDGENPFSNLKYNKIKDYIYILVNETEIVDLISSDYDTYVNQFDILINVISIWTAFEMGRHVFIDTSHYVTRILHLSKPIVYFKFKDLLRRSMLKLDICDDDPSNEETNDLHLLFMMICCKKLDESNQLTSMQMILEHNTLVKQSAKMMSKDKYPTPLFKPVNNDISEVILENDLEEYKSQLTDKCLFSLPLNEATKIKRINDGIFCSICERTESLMKLDLCGHYICLNCFTQMKTLLFNGCPLCRTPMYNSENLVKIQKLRDNEVHTTNSLESIIRSHSPPQS